MLGWARGHELEAPGPGMGLGAGALEMSAGASESHVPPRPTCRLAPRGNPGAFSEPLSPYARAPGKRGSRAACLVCSQAFVFSCAQSL